MNTLESLKLSDRQRTAVLHLVEDACYVLYNQVCCNITLKHAIHEALLLANTRLPKAIAKTCQHDATRDCTLPTRCKVDGKCYNKKWNEWARALDRKEA